MPSPRIAALADSLVSGGWMWYNNQHEKQLNPFDCDHATQWVSAEDGSCIAHSDFDCESVGQITRIDDTCGEVLPDPEQECAVYQLTYNPQTGLCTQVK